MPEVYGFKCDTRPKLVCRKSDRSQEFLYSPVMAYNLTGFNLEVYVTANSVVNASVFFFFVLPAFILCLLCVIGLFHAKNVKWQMLVLLVNIFVVEICFWLALSVTFIGFPFRAANLVKNDFSCNVSTSLFFAVILQRFTAVAIYSVMVYVFLKHD